MKKHIFGIAVFCSIVALFALIFAFIYAPVIPQIEEVKQVETKYEKPSYCNLKRQNTTSFEVLSSYYFYDEGKIITKIKLNHNENSPKPEKVFIATSFNKTDGFSRIDVVNQVVENPFAESNEKIVEIVSRISSTGKNGRSENLYAKVNVTQTEFYLDERLTQAKAVLFVHGNSSIIKK
jgi:ABC-type branched-subunit amino acid transport system ATPase component